MSKVRAKTRPLGSIKLEPKKRWYTARLPYSVDPNRGQVKGRFKTVREAQQAINIAIRTYTPQPINKSIQRSTGLTLGALCEQYIETRYTDKDNPIALRTKESYTYLYRHYVKDTALGKMNPNTVTTNILKTHMSGYTKKAREFLGAVFAWANDGILDTPVFFPTVKARYTKQTAYRNNKNTVRLPTFQELADMVAVETLPYRWRVMILLGAFCGLRLSECLALSPDDIVPGVGVVVDKVYIWDFQNKRWTKEPVKSGVSEVVPVPALLLEYLQTVADESVNDLLFYSYSNTHQHPGAWSRSVWNPTRNKAGISNDLRFKDLRAYAGSLLVDCGATPIEAAALLRHSPTVSVTHYLRQNPDPVKMSIREKLDGCTVSERLNNMFNMFVSEYPKVKQALAV